MKVLIDGVFFQLANTGIARVWRELLLRLSRRSDIEISLLNRGLCPIIPNTKYIKFPPYYHFYTAADSLLINQIAIEINADVFTSTYYTTPTSIPMAMLVHDMIPEILGFDLNARPWKEKQLSISFATRYACVSKQTKIDLIAHYPGKSRERAAIAHCGVDPDVFKPRTPAAVALLRQKHNLRKPYFLFIGSRSQPYKNADLFLEATILSGIKDISICIVGGAHQEYSQWQHILKNDIELVCINPDDADLSCIYSDAEALVYPSSYEGFGLPLIEAMACGCPVIATPISVFSEVAADAALFLSNSNPKALASAMIAVRNPDLKSNLISKGLKRVHQFSWDSMEEVVYQQLRLARDDGLKNQPFFRDWNRIRGLQSATDEGR